MCMDSVEPKDNKVNFLSYKIGTPKKKNIKTLGEFTQTEGFIRRNRVINRINKSFINKEGKEFLKKAQ